MSTQRIAWKRLLVLGREVETIAATIRSARPDLEVTGKSLDEATAADVSRAEMLLGFRVPSSVAPAMSELRWIQSTGAGVDGILASGGLSRHTLLTRVLDVFGPPMSDYVLLHCLAIAQDVERTQRAQRERRWDVFYPRLLSEMKIAVLGVGEIGGAIARRLATNGARVVGISRSGRPVDGIDDVRPAARIDEAVSGADALVVVVPNTADTRAIIGARELRAMRRGAWLVNVARGSCVDEPALIAALADGHLGGAVLDVFATEPLPDDSPLWSFENVRVTPHISGLTRPEQAAAAFLDNLARLERGEAPRGRVDVSRGY